MNELHKLFMDILINKDTPQQEVIDANFGMVPVGYLFEIRFGSRF